MESLNKVELVGYVGFIKVSNVGGAKVAKFSVATDRAYESNDGEVVVETTWHNVIAWDEEPGAGNLDDIVKGARVYVEGRIRTNKFVGIDGNERAVTEIFACRVKVLSDKT